MEAADDVAQKTEYITRKLAFVSQFIMFDVEGELWDEYKDELIKNWESDLANLTFTFENIDTMKVIQILERVLNLTSRDNKNFFAGLVVELAKAYKAQSEKVLDDLKIAEELSSKGDVYRL